MKICQENQNLLQIWQNIEALHVNIKVYFVAASDTDFAIQAFTSSEMPRDCYDIRGGTNIM